MGGNGDGGADGVKIRRRKIWEYRPDPRNANMGTERGREMIETSLCESGAGRSLVAAADDTIPAGNKTLEVAASIGLQDVIEVETDGRTLVVVKRTDWDTVNVPAARAYAYRDNRTAEIDLEWDREQVLADWRAGLVPSDLWSTHEIDVWAEHLREETPEEFDDLPDELPGAAALKEAMYFDSTEIYNIPPLLPNMLSDLPEPIDVWAGQDAADPNWGGWYLYSYGTDSIRGLDTRRTVLAFYTDDYRFENWFAEPAKYTARALNAGISIMVAPNFSLWHNDPQALHIFNVYRARFLARYFQEAGIKVIPDVNWADRHTFDFCLAGIPVGLPCVSMQIQTVAVADEVERLQ